MWHHWVPAAWRGPWPFEIGLYFFLNLTGFLITRILLRERAAAEAQGGSWRRKAYYHFQKRRLGRILLPCYVAMVFAMVVGASDILHHPLPYFGHWSNFHMAFLERWPSGTAHYWTLAVQMQFYFIWPFLVFLLPRKWLAPAFVICVALAPLARWILARDFPQIHHPGAVSFCSLDYLGVGALLALTFDRGMQPGNKTLTRVSAAAFLVYAVLYGFNEAGRTVPVLGHFQQTLVSIAFAGLISRTLAGFDDLRGKILEHPAVQHIGKLSYGLYLFHTPAPLLLGWILPQLWGPFFTGPWEMIRLGVFALVSWGLGWLCWRYLETRPAHPNKHAVSDSPDR